MSGNVAYEKGLATTLTKLFWRMSLESTVKFEMEIDQHTVALWYFYSEEAVACALVSMNRNLRIEYAQPKGDLYQNQKRLSISQLNWSSKSIRVSPF